MEEASKPTILVIENDEETRQVYTDVLSNTGAQVRQAANAYEAFEHLRAHTVSLIVTDLHMPGGGLQYLSTLRGHQPSCPIVTITGLAGGEIIRQATLIAGATAFLEKPIRARQLREIVDRLLSSSSPIAV